MKLDDVTEWMQIADDDFDSAAILNEAVRKHCEVICYLCAQAVEKYLKAFLTYNDIIPEKTHNLPFLNGLCIERNSDFQSAKQLCDFLNRFTGDIRYPHKYGVTENDVNFCINSVEKIKNLPIMIDIRNIGTKIAANAQHTETHRERVEGGL